VNLGAGWSQSFDANAGWAAIFQRCIASFTTQPEVSSICYGKPNQSIYAVYLRQKAIPSCVALSPVAVGSRNVSHGYNGSTTNQDASMIPGVFTATHQQQTACVLNLTPGPAKPFLDHKTAAVSGSSTLMCATTQHYSFNFGNGPIDPLTNPKAIISIPSANTGVLPIVTNITGGCAMSGTNTLVCDLTGSSIP
jgi:hypothetical protein